MKNLIVIIALTSAVQYVNAQDKECNCSEFYTGSFYLLEPGSNDTCFIFRTANYQNEVIPSQDIDAKFDITWTSECTYILSDPNDGLRKSPLDVFAKIIETGENYYIVKAHARKGKTLYFTIYRYQP